MDKLLNKTDIEKIIGEPLIFYTNHELKFIRNVEELFNGNDKVLLLYVGDDHIGHWTGLKIYGDTLMYFDSFGEVPDDPLKALPKKYHADLSRILYNTNDYNLQYNAIKLQSDYANTCGRWCALFFIYCTDIDLFAEIFEYFKKDINLDKLVYQLTI